MFDIFEEGPGFPFFFPKGMVLRNELENYWREIHRKAGYEEIKTPMILSRKLWEQSGHWDHYQENMYTTKIDDEDFAIKPMNCPGGILVYKRRMWSYRDLPIRSGELGLVHRHELSGALHGLMRVRCFTQDDAHIFMTPEQIRDEIKGVYRLIDEVYSSFGFKYHVELSTRPENSIGTDEMWEQATEGLQGALDDLGVEYVVNEGDGAFYGPKIDFHLEAVSYTHPFSKSSSLPAMIWVGSSGLNIHASASSGIGAGVFSPPAGGVVSPPAGGVVSPPAGGVVSPPAGGVVSPPVGGVVCVSAGGVVCVSAGGVVCVSAGGVVCVFAGGVVCVSAGGVVCVSAGGSACVVCVSGGCTGGCDSPPSANAPLANMQTANSAASKRFIAVIPLFCIAPGAHFSSLRRGRCSMSIY